MALSLLSVSLHSLHQLLTFPCFPAPFSPSLPPPSLPSLPPASLLWFSRWVRRRGLVMGLGGATMSLGVIGLFPNLIRILSDAHGYRSTYVILAFMCLVQQPPHATPLT